MENGRLPAQTAVSIAHILSYKPKFPLRLFGLPSLTDSVAIRFFTYSIIIVWCCEYSASCELYFRRYIFERHVAYSTL